MQYSRFIASKDFVRVHFRDLFRYEPSLDRMLSLSTLAVHSIVEDRLSAFYIANEVVHIHGVDQILCGLLLIESAQALTTESMCAYLGLVVTS